MAPFLARFAAQVLQYCGDLSIILPPVEAFSLEAIRNLTALRQSFKTNVVSEWACAV